MTVSAGFNCSFFHSQLKHFYVSKMLGVFSPPHTHFNTQNEATCAYVKVQPNLNYTLLYINLRRSQWPRGLRRRSTATRLLRLWVRNPPGARMSIYFECCVLSCRGLCDGLITRPEESYLLWYGAVCDLETSRMRR